MLILTRRSKESIIINKNIQIEVLEIRGGHVRIGIKAPRCISVYRNEIYEKIKKGNFLTAKDSSRLGIGDQHYSVGLEVLDLS